LAQLGNIDEAKSSLQLAVDEKPDLSITYLKKTLPTKYEGGLETYLNGLRKAGLPE
jgi:adenylate cyclase